MELTVFVFFGLAYFTWHNVFNALPCYSMLKNFVLYNAGQDVEKLKPLCTSGGTSAVIMEKFGGFSKN